MELPLGKEFQNLSCFQMKTLQAHLRFVLVQQVTYIVNNLVQKRDLRLKARQPIKLFFSTET